MANMPNRLTKRPRVLTINSWAILFITGGSIMRCTASNRINTLINTRKTPLAKPDSVSTRLYPNGKSLLVFHDAMTLAIKPMKIAAQSKNI